MNGRDEHGKIDQLLPLYANGALDIATRARVSRHLEVCAACREELAFLGDVRAVLRHSVAAERRDNPPPEPRFETLPAELQLRVRDSASHRRWAALPNVWATAVALAAAIALGTFIGMSQQSTVAAYRTATSGSEIAQPHVQVAVRFEGDAALAHLHQLLREHRAAIVRAPGADDTWLLEIPLADDADVQTLLNTLRRTPGIEAVHAPEPVAGSR